MLSCPITSQKNLWNFLFHISQPPLIRFLLHSTRIVLVEVNSDPHVIHPMPTTLFSSLPCLTSQHLWAHIIPSSWKHDFLLTVDTYCVCIPGNSLALPPTLLFLVLLPLWIFPFSVFLCLVLAVLSFILISLLITSSSWLQMRYIFRDFKLSHPVLISLLDFRTVFPTDYLSTWIFNVNLKFNIPKFQNSALPFSKPN